MSHMCRDYQYLFQEKQLLNPVDGIVGVVPQDLRHALGSRLTKKQRSLPGLQLRCHRN